MSKDLSLSLLFYVIYAAIMLWAYNHGGFQEPLP